MQVKRRKVKRRIILRPAVLATALAVLIGTAALAPQATGSVVDDNPAVSAGPGQVPIVGVRVETGATFLRAYENYAWGPWVDAGGISTSGPALSRRPDGTLDVFTRGQDHALWHKYGTTTGFTSEWGSLGGNLASAPSATNRKGTPFIDVVGRQSGTNEVIFKTWDPSGGWSGWMSLGGDTRSSPAIISQQDGVINVFARGSDNAIWQRFHNGWEWSPWMSLGGNAASSPSATSQGPGLLDLYYTAPDGVVWQRSWNGSSWSSWVSIPTYATSAPAAFSEGPGRVGLFVRGGGQLYLNQYVYTGWTGWNIFDPADDGTVDLVPNGTGEEPEATGASPLIPFATPNSSQALRCTTRWANWKVEVKYKFIGTFDAGNVQHRGRFCFRNSSPATTSFGNVNNVLTSVNMLGGFEGFDLTPQDATHYFEPFDGASRGRIFIERLVKIKQAQTFLGKLGFGREQTWLLRIMGTKSGLSVAYRFVHN
jgi:hypothetical protein